MLQREVSEKIDILLVDDRKENLFSLETILNCPEYNLIKTNSGEAALRYLLKHTPALILMDVQMPGLNGFETASIIKGSERTREIPIIFITAINKDEHFIHEGYDHGAVDYIYKPYDAYVLKAKVAVFANLMRQSQRISRLVAVQKAATEALADSCDVNSAILTVLKSICTSLGWDLGMFWEVDQNSQVLRCKQQWHSPENFFSDFIESSFKRCFKMEEGFLGRIWKNKKADWVPKISQDNRILRFAISEFDPLQTAVGIPICFQNEVFGVMEFYCKENLQEDSDLLDIMGAIGNQIGQAIKRTEALNLIRASEARSTFLVKATATLYSSLNYEETFTTIAQMAVNTLSDWCAIYILDEEDQPAAVAIAHSDEDKKELANNLCKSFDFNWKDIPGFSQGFQASKPKICSQISDELLAKLAINENHHQMMKDLGFQSVMLVPLVIRKKVLGVVTFVSTQVSRVYSKEDLMLAEELAHRAAIAIDNARLYHEAQNAIQARDDFFSIVSHELKSPLTALKMMMEMTQRRIKAEENTNPTTEKLMRVMTSANKQVDRMNSLVDDLLDLVRIRAGRLSLKLQEFNLSELVREVVGRYSDTLEAAQCSLQLDLVPEVFGTWDCTRIEQILVNLISNAIKYAPNSPIKIELYQSLGMATLTVQDFGPGIPQHQHSKIFERFERAISAKNISGLGLGLFIVKQIVQAHHGSVSVESESGQGTSFIIELPTTVPEYPNLQHEQSWNFSQLQ